MTQSDDWATSTVNRVGQQVRLLRGRTPKRSAQWLADRTAELGYPMTRTVISDLENGRRGGRLDITELLVLGRALDVAPLLLLYPGVPHAEVDALPGMTVDSVHAMFWFTGEDYAFECVPRPFETEPDGGDWLLDVAPPLELVRRFYYAVEQVSRAREGLETAGSEAVGYWRHELRDGQEDIARIAPQMQRSGLTVRREYVDALLEGQVLPLRTAYVNMRVKTDPPRPQP